MSKHHSRKRIRSSMGFSLVEAVVSVLIGTLFTGIFLDVYSKMQRVTTTSENETRANFACQELLEGSRAANFGQLAANVGRTFSLLPERTVLGQDGPIEIRKQPVLFDLVNKSWTKMTSAIGTSRTITYKIEDAAGPPPDGEEAKDPTSLIVTVTVEWNDSEHSKTTSSNAFRRVVGKTLITSAGINKWRW